MSHRGKPRRHPLSRKFQRLLLFPSSRGRRRRHPFPQTQEASLSLFAQLHRDTRGEDPSSRSSLLSMGGRREAFLPPLDEKSSRIRACNLFLGKNLSSCDSPFFAPSIFRREEREGAFDTFLPRTERGEGILFLLPPFRPESGFSGCERRNRHGAGPFFRRRQDKDFCLPP